VAREIPEAGLARVRERCEADVWPGPLPPPREVLLERVAGCEGLLALLTDRVDAELMDRAPRLRVVSNYAVGFDNVDVAAAAARGIAVGNTPDVLTDATADLALALLLAAARRVVEGDRYARSGRWRTWEPLGHIGQDLAGRTLGLFGMGRIGTALARRCRGGFGMRVLYCDPRPNPEAESELGARRVELPALLAESDFVSAHANLDDSTRRVFDARAFRAMKRTAVFVNTARGGLVDQPALAEALRGGEIFAAGLDVTDPEPPAVDDPLLGAPHLVLTPHVASATVASRNAMAEIAADNLLLGLEGRRLRCPVADAVAHARRAG
jgi:glyoxylate reductase